MADVVIATFSIAVFTLAVILIATLAIQGAIYRHRHPRTREQRRADEHGDIAPGKFKLSGGADQFPN